jgi:predicted metal-dependent hydrolase
MPSSPLQTALAHFQDLFNAGDYFEAHEVLEAQWLLETGERKLFLQGLIQLAAAMIKWREANWRGAKRLIQAASEKLNQAHSDEGLMCLIRTFASKIEAEEPFEVPPPLINMSASSACGMP